MPVISIILVAVTVTKIQESGSLNRVFENGLKNGTWFGGNTLHSSRNILDKEGVFSFPLAKFPYPL
jgi:hypothetical protein